jgi:hypothetical protein
MSEFMLNPIGCCNGRESPGNSTYHCDFCNAAMAHGNSDSKLHTLVGPALTGKTSGVTLQM